MKTIFYKKEGRKYVPVSEYDSDYQDSFRKGNHLIMSYPGGQSTRFNIDPTFAPMIAAGRYAEDAMCDAMRSASEMHPQQKPVTAGQRAAWQNLAKEFGSDLCPLQYASSRDVVEAGIKAMQVEADKLLQLPAVKAAYEEFMLICKLSR